jgi:hypothetical protein
VSLESRGVTLAAVGFKRRKSRSLDDIENIEAQISYLQEDIGQRLQLLNDSQSTGQFKQSTPKPVDSETERSDSGIVIGQQSPPHGGARPKTTKMILMPAKMQLALFYPKK